MDAEHRISDERKFLHDLASPLGTATLVLDMILENAKKRPDVSTSELDQIQMAIKALDKMKIKLQERREMLVSQSKL